MQLHPSPLRVAYTEKFLELMSPLALAPPRLALGVLSAPKYLSAHPLDWLLMTGLIASRIATAETQLQHKPEDVLARLEVSLRFSGRDQGRQ